MENPVVLSSETDEINSIFQYFPIEIIIEIMSRLPVKTLFRFSTISKYWYSLVRTPMFLSEHFKNHTLSVVGSSCNRMLLLPTVIRESDKCSLFCDSTFVKIENFDMPMLRQWPEIAYIGNSCNGILCFEDHQGFFGRKVCLLNPSIRKMKLISSDCNADRKYDRRRVFSKLGFGFCECSNDFKVVRINYIKDEEWRLVGSVPPEVEVYSLNAAEWRRIEANVQCIVNNKSVSCNGYICWLARRKNERIYDAIVSFDIAREVFCEFELPVKCDRSSDGYILVFNGLVALFYFDYSDSSRKGVHCYELWVMQEYKVAESWTKLSILETNKFVTEVFGFTKSGKLVMQMNCDMLASWDPENNNIIDLQIDGSHNHVDTAFVESLILYEGVSDASADLKKLVGETSQNMRIMEPQELLYMETHKIPIHGDDVVVRVAADVATVNCGIHELKSLCWKRPALVGIMAKTRDLPSTLQLCVENYCLIVQENYLDRIPESLADFLFNPEIRFITIGPERSSLWPADSERSGIEFSELVEMALNKQYVGRWGLKPLADEVGVALEEYPVEFGLDWQTEDFSVEDIKWAVYHVYAAYKIGHKLFHSLPPYLFERPFGPC